MTTLSFKGRQFRIIENLLVFLKKSSFRTTFGQKKTVSVKILGKVGSYSQCGLGLLYFGMGINREESLKFSSQNQFSQKELKLVWKYPHIVYNYLESSMFKD